MLIDWVTVAAQAGNFLILVWLLKRLLYRPILKAIDAREQLIAGELAQADAARAEAERERSEFRQKNAEFEQLRATRMRQLDDEARAERRRLLASARQAADALGAARRAALEREQQHLQDELGRRTREEVFAIARQTLRDLAGTALEERMAEALIRRLQALEPGAKAALVAALRVSRGAAAVRSAFALPAAQRAAIGQAVGDIAAGAAPAVELSFETAPEVISGIELRCGGYKFAWSIAEYLTALEQSVAELLGGQTGAGAEGLAPPGFARDAR